MGRKTGCLTVTDRSSFGYIYLDDGRVVYANVLNRPDRLGELLVRNGAIDREALSQAMEQQAREPGRRLGQILVDQGALTNDELLRFITIQIEEAVYHLFAWERGSFQFDADARPDAENASHVSINAESLLLEGARRVDEWSQIEKKIPSMDVVFAREGRPADEEGAPELTPAQLTLLELVDGTRAVEELVHESGLVEFDVAKALYGLLQAGFISRRGERKRAGKGEERRVGVNERLNVAQAYYRAGMFEDAEREYRGVLEVDPVDETARGRLALIALRARRLQEALEHYEAAPDTVREGYVGLRNRALALELLGRPEDALELLDRAARLRPEDGALLLERAVALLKANRPSEARDLLRRYRDGVGPTGRVPPLYYAYGVLALAAAGDAEGAVRLGREGITRYPDSGEILVNLAVVLEERGEREAAESFYLRAVSEPPAPPQAHRNLGDLAYRRGDHAGARAHFERAVRIDPALGDDVYLKLGNLSYKEGDRDLALQHWRRALELNPRNEVVRTNLELAASSLPR
jgi:tetratricopeptide (TPR) repeat protein